MLTSSEQLDEFRALIRSAFEQAQRSGKRDWEEMTSAVEKNRLSNITEDKFHRPAMVRHPLLIWCGGRQTCSKYRRLPSISAPDYFSGHDTGGYSPPTRG